MSNLTKFKLNRSLRRRLDKSQLNAFYQLFLNTFEDTTDTPMEFIFTALLPSLGAAVSLQRWIRWGSKKIYPNIWTMLVAESTNLRKSTALNIGLHFNEIMEQKVSDKNFILPSGGSMAALLQVLEHEKNGVIRHSEVSSMLLNMGKGYNSDMKSLFTDFYDVPASYKVYLKKSDLIIEQPIFSMATATTVDWLKKNISKSDSESGFLARFCYCYANKKDNSTAVPGEPSEAQMTKLVDFYAKLFNLESREIKLDDSYKSLYTQFYNDIDVLMDDPFMDNGTRSLIGRIQTDIFLKLTILECVLSGEDVANESIGLRVRYLAEFYLEQAFVIMDLIQKTDNAKREEKIMEYLQIHRIVSTSELHRLFNNNLTAPALRGITNSLQDAGLIQKTTKGKMTYYKICTENES